MLRSALCVTIATSFTLLPSLIVMSCKDNHFRTNSESVLLVSLDVGDSSIQAGFISLSPWWRGRRHEVRPSRPASAGITWILTPFLIMAASPLRAVSLHSLHWGWKNVSDERYVIFKGLRQLIAISLSSVRKSWVFSSVVSWLHSKIIVSYWSKFRDNKLTATCRIRWTIIPTGSTCGSRLPGAKIASKTATPKLLRLLIVLLVRSAIVLLYGMMSDVMMLEELQLHIARSIHNTLGDKYWSSWFMSPKVLEGFGACEPWDESLVRGTVSSWFLPEVSSLLGKIRINNWYWNMMQLSQNRRRCSH